MMIAFPPCTHLAISGAAWFSEKEVLQKEALSFVEFLLNVPIGKICIENPVGVISSYIKKPTQYIQPYQFGHMQSKKTGLWLKNLPALVPTKIVTPYLGNALYNRNRKKGMRGHLRSKTFQGIADAMAAQWGTA